MYDLIKGLAAQLLMPLPISLGLMGLGLVLLMWRYRRTGWSVATLGLAVLVLSSWGPVAERLLMPLETRHPSLQALPDGTTAEAVVVLGGGWRPDAPWSSVGRLNDSSAIRLMEGIRLWRLAPELPLIVTGASRRADVAPIAQGYAQAARELGVPEAQLRVLDWPTDTGQEAQAVRDALGEGARVVLVTSASHMPRSMRHFQQVGLDPVAAPTHYLVNVGRERSLGFWVPSAGHLRKSERAVYEALGLLMVGREG
ncbi:ElyC/SanA/YdcF family protein [Halomonas sp. HK25]|uniref:ElyC/SanA/YdcF family protein n=1 Tax=Halomonas sp. HK25 TaxID=3394321 RepID=UPI0039FDCE53